MIEILYHPRVHEDISGIQKSDSDRIEAVIEKKLKRYPELFGAKLRGRLEDFWKLRVGNYRIIYQPSKKTVHILAIRNRKNVYKLAEQRLG